MTCSQKTYVGLLFSEHFWKNCRRSLESSISTQSSSAHVEERERHGDLYNCAYFWSYIRQSLAFSRGYIAIGVRAIFCPEGGGGSKLFAQKPLASRPNFYETVEKKRGSYDATT